MLTEEFVGRSELVMALAVGLPWWVGCALGPRAGCPLPVAHAVAPTLRLMPRRPASSATASRRYRSWPTATPSLLAASSSDRLGLFRRSVHVLGQVHRDPRVDQGERALG